MIHLQHVRKIGLLFAVMIALVACFEYDAVVHINPDGSGKAEFTYRFPQGLVDKSDIGDKIPLSQADVDARYRMRAGVTQYRADFRELAEFKEVRVFVDFDNVRSLSERGNTFSYDVEGAYRVYRVRIDKQSASASLKKQPPMQQKMMKNMLDRYKISYKVFLPQKIDTSNAQSVEWNAATWEIPLSVFLSEEKHVIVLEAKSRIGLWERLSYRVRKLLG